MRRLSLLMLVALLTVSCANIQTRSYTRFRGDRCEWCGTTDRLEWCHEKPQALFPELRNDPANGATLCRKCHLCLNHYQNTKRWNLNFLVIVHTYGGKWETERK